MKSALACLIFFGLEVSTGFAILPSEQEPLPNFDQRLQGRGALAAGGRQNPQAGVPALQGKIPGLPQEKRVALTRLQNQLPEAKVHWDRLLGTPRWIYAPGTHLTDPNGEGRAVSPATARALLPNEAHRAVKGFLNEHAALFGHDAGVLQRARVVRDFTSPHNGLRTVIWQQELDHVPVFDGLLIAHTTKKGELASLSSQFVPEAALEGSATSRAEEKRRQVAALHTAGTPALPALPKISAVQAIANAAANVGEKLSLEQVLPIAGKAAGREGVKLFSARAALKGETEARLVWLPLDSTRLRLCWEIILTSQARRETFRLLIDAETGEALVRHCLTVYLTPATYRVFVQESPTPLLPGYSTPTTNQPPVVARVLVVTNALDTNASPNGWINDGDNETRGNNVDAALDWDANDQPDLPRPQGSPGRVFNFPLDLTQGPSSYTDASVVQLFYWCNWMHDKLYELGFTEAAGNFQMTNFGRGGYGNDAVRADAQDGSGVNNANMTTLPDGSAARLQMYLFTGPNPDRDGVLDATVVLHEYTHGLSNRRVGGGVGLTALQSEGLGEGWSDFYALALLSGPNADPDGTYPCAAYASYLLAGLRYNYYFGIRRYPYTTGLVKNPLTFKDIDPAQASSHAGIPRSPVFGSSAADEVHAQGEVWGVTLWEARANFIRKYGFETGNHLILQLITEAMNLTPPNPNFLEARDAIIQADLINQGGANFNELWQAFAKRGLGFSASCPDSSTTAGLQESFDQPDTLWVTPAGGFVAFGPVGGPFNPFSQTFILTNLSTNALEWRASVAERWLSLSSQAGLLSTDAPATTLHVSINGIATLLPAGSYTNVLFFTNLSTGRSQAKLVVLRVGARDYFTESFERGNNDLPYQTLMFTPDGSANFYSVCRQPATSFPADPLAGKTMVLADDNFQACTLAGNTQVSLYGKRTNVFFIGSNGYLTLDSGDTYMLGTLAKHFRLPRVAALFTDLDPSAGGRVSWEQWADRVAVTFQDVPEYGTANSNSFQIEMFLDGRIRLTHLHIDAHGGLAGLSSGQGVPADFYNSDFNSYSPCGGQLFLSIPAEAAEGDGVLPGQGQVRLPTAPATNVLAALSSSDSSEVIVPPAVMIPAGQTNAAFDLQVLEDGILDGTQIVMVRAAAPGYSEGSATIWIHDHETATLGLSLPASVAESSGSVTGVVTSSAPVAEDVIIFLTSSNPSKIQAPPWIVLPSGTDAAPLTLRALDNGLIDGDQAVSITAHVPNWVDGAASINVLDDETNNLLVSIPSSTYENAGPLPNLGEVSVAGYLSSNLTVFLFSDNTTKMQVPESVTIPAGQTNTTFVLVAQDNFVVDGNHLVTITARALGFVDGSSTILVQDDDIPPAPSNPLPPDMSSNQIQGLSLSWNLGIEHGDLIANGGFETGSFDGWGVENSENNGWHINRGTNSAQSGEGPVTPYFGRYGAFTDQNGPGQHSLWQQITISPETGRAVLSWTQRLHNFANNFATNQQFRIEIRSTNGTLLKIVYATQPGDPLIQDWTEQSADLTAFRGQTVRIVFVEEDGLNFLNVYLDNIRLLLSPSVPTTYDVYFGTNPTPGPTEYLGATTNGGWDLPVLAPLTTYYWQVIARRADQTPGPVWQFTTRGVDHFAWDPIPSPQRVGQPIGVTVTAVDPFGVPVTNFAGQVNLSAWTGPVSTTLFSDNFESGNFDAWRKDGGNYLRAVTNHSVAQGRYSFTLVGGAGMTFDGVTRLLPNLRPDRINFYLRAARNDRDAGYFVAGVPPLESSAAITFHLDARGRMGFFSPSGQPVSTQYYTSNQWYKISFVLHWVGKKFDYFVDEQLIQSGIAFGKTNVESLSLLSLFNFDATQVWWDEIEFLTQAAPFQFAVSPSSTGSFSQGAWSGTMVVQALASAVQLQAGDSEGHAGLSSGFSVLPPDDLGLQVAATPNPGVAGQNMHYGILVVNPGPSLAKGVTLTNLLSEGVSFLSVTPSQGQCVNLAGVVICQLGTIDANSPATVQLEFVPSHAGLLTNFTTVGRAESDPFTGNNFITTVTPVFPAVSQLPVYVRSRVEAPWGLTANEAAMDRVFGAGNWQDLRYETVDVSSLLSSNTPFIYLEGSDLDATEMESFLAAHRPEMEQWVSNGGSLFLNAAPNENDGMDFGFGAQLVYPDLTEAAMAADFAHPIFMRPFAPVGTAWTGRSFAHATLAGIGFTPLINNQDNGRPVLAEKSFGAGHILFGGMSPAVFHTPQPEAVNLLANILAYGGSFSQRGRVHHFAWNQIDSPQRLNQAFSVTLTALDSFNVPVTNFFGGVVLRSFPLADTNSQLALLPAQAGPFTNGLWSGEITLSEGAAKGVLQADDGLGHLGTSNPFTLAASNDLSVSLSVEPKYILQGSNLTYHLQIDNSGPDTATGVILTNILPVSVSFVSAHASQGTCSANTGNIVCDLGALGSNETATVTIRVIPNAPGTITNQAVVGRTEADTNEANNWDTLTSEVLPVAQIAIEDMTVSERDSDYSMAYFQLSLSSTSAVPVEVDFYSVDGTATGGSDYVPVSGHLVFPPGLTNQAIPVKIMGDTLFEGDETFFIVLTNAINAGLGREQGTGTILDNEWPPALWINDARIREPESGATNVLFEVQLAEPAAVPVSVDFSTSDGTALAGVDYQGTNGTLIFSPGVTNQFINVPINANADSESAKIFYVNLANASNAFPLNDQAVGTILDKLFLPTLAIADTSVIEGTGQNSLAVFSIYLSDPFTQTISVHYATRDGTALAGSDYLAQEGDLYFAPGETSQNVYVPVIGDALHEDNETFFIQLSNPVQAVLSLTSGTVTIIDDDAPPLVSIADASILEGNTGSRNALLPVSLSEPSGATLTVAYRTVDGAATAGLDYLSTNGLLTFPPGLTNQNISVTVLGDTLIESNETVQVLLSDVTNGILGRAQAQLTIENDDGLPGDLDHFEWSAIPSPQTSSVPFPVGLIARDRFGQVASNFSGTVALGASTVEAEAPVGSGNVSSVYPLASFFAKARSQVIYLASEIGPARQFGGLALEVIGVPGQILSNWTIRAQPTSLSNYFGSANWENAGWTTLYHGDASITATGWFSFVFTTPYPYDGSNNLMLDFSFNNAASSFDGECRATTTDQSRSLGFAADAGFGDPLSWSGPAAPIPLAGSTVPNLRLIPCETPLPLQPTNSGAFSEGMWSGNILLPLAAAQVHLWASVSQDTASPSNPFQVAAPTNQSLVIEIVRIGNAVRLSWPATIQTTYRVEFKQDLSEPNWNALPEDVVATGPVAMKDDFIQPSQQRFYRVKALR